MVQGAASKSWKFQRIIVCGNSTFFPIFNKLQELLQNICLCSCSNSVDVNDHFGPLHPVLLIYREQIGCHCHCQVYPVAITKLSVVICDRI